jgi:tetratricopeptide (TPR) repeat protein
VGADAFRRWLVTQVASGKCVLFLGSGVARASCDRGGRSGPLGSELAEEIGTHFLGRYEGWSLPQTSAYAIALAGRPDVEQFVRQRLQGLIPSPGLRTIPRLPWKSVYTTNFDCLVEHAYTEDNEKVRDIHPMYTSLARLRDLEPNEIPYYKLHGCISRIDHVDGSLVLTSEDMAKARQQRQKLFQRLADDMSEYTILYIGYARQDPNFDELLGEVIDQVGGPAHAPRSYAVSPHIEDFEKAYWEARKITLIPEDSETFLQSLAVECQRVSTQGVELNVGLPGIVPDSANLSQSTIQRFRGKFEVIEEEVTKGASDFSSFFRGNRPSWGQIVANCDARREIAEEVILELLAHRQVSGPRLVLIRAEAGAGKTTLLRRVGVELTRTWGLHAVALRENVSLDFDTIELVSRHVPERLYICVDDGEDHAKEISEFVTTAKRASTSVTIIAAARANEWAQKAVQFPLPPSSTFDIWHLTEAEINSLLAKLEEFNELGVLKGLSIGERRTALRIRADRQLLVALREATEGKQFDEIIRDEFDAIPSSEAQAAYLFVCSVFQAGVALRAGVLRRLTGVPFEEFTERILNPTERIIVLEADQYGTACRARHRVIAEVVVNHKLPNAVERLGLYKSIIEILDLGYEEDLEAYRRLSRNRELVESLGLQDLKREFYRTCRSVDDKDAIVVQHWAIMEMEGGRLDAAERLLMDAQKLAPKDPAIQHSTGMLYFRRYQHESGSAWEKIYFENADQTFSNLIRRYPAQVAPYDSLARLYQERADRSEHPPERVDWYSKAHDVLLKGIRSTSDKSSLYAGEGRLRDRMGEFADADSAFRMALREGPLNGAARHLYARFLIDRQRPEDAVTVLEQGLDWDSEDRRLRHSLAVAYALTGRSMEQVLNQFRLASTSLIIHWPAAFDMAVYLYLQGREQEASAVFRDLKELELDQWDKRRIRPIPAFPGGEDLHRQGRVVQIRDTFGFIEIPGHPEWVYIDRYWVSPTLDPQLKIGKIVDFQVVFNLMGPVARTIDSVSQDV